MMSVRYSQSSLATQFVNIARILVLLPVLPALFDCRMFPEETVLSPGRASEIGRMSFLPAAWPLPSRPRSKEPAILQSRVSDVKVGLLWRC